MSFVSKPGLERRLKREISGDVLVDAFSRGRYATDASIYQMMPLGIVIILLGYYGVANSIYDFEREAYQVSGGFLGLGVTFLGGFLYFGAWLARIAYDNQQASGRLADTLLVLADVTSRAAATHEPAADVQALPVTAGDGTTLHRRDCALIAHRQDLHPGGGRTGLTSCRVCKP